MIASDQLPAMVAQLDADGARHQTLVPQPLCQIDSHRLVEVPEPARVGFPAGKCTLGADGLAALVQAERAVVDAECTLVQLHSPPWAKDGGKLGRVGDRQVAERQV